MEAAFFGGRMMIARMKSRALDFACVLPWNLERLDHLDILHPAAAAGSSWQR